jgi:hypothetical protein
MEESYEGRYGPTVESVFLVVLENQPSIKLSAEHLAYHWTDITEANPHTDAVLAAIPYPFQRRAFQKAMERMGDLERSSRHLPGSLV